MTLNQLIKLQFVVFVLLVSNVHVLKFLHSDCNRQVCFWIVHPSIL